ncbi:MAG: hypothetical protein BM556_08865 [Bacteriovorax sp. MedPE-SWde]|nr:MAG: hypothetical protein BM556_08865 [Bacteriovorax sp. MedPE-SWde]
MTMLINYFKKISYLIPIFNIKTIAGHKTFLPLLFPLLGWLNFFKEKKIMKVTSFIVILPLYSIVLGAINKDIESIARSFQLLGLMLSIDLFSTIADKKYLKNFTKVTIVLTLIIIFYELFATELMSTHYMMSIKRFRLILGEPNFSAFFYVLLLSLLIDSKSSYKLRIPLVLFTLMTMSRMGMIALLMLAFIQVLSNKKGIIAILAIAFFSFPIILYFSNSMMPKTTIEKLSKNYSRYYIQTIYVENLKNNVFGSGYFRSKKANKMYIKENSESIKKKFGITHIGITEQHNGSVQLVSDFGIFIYIYIISLFFYFKIPERCKFYGNAVVTIFLCSFFLNFMNEILIYITIGAIIKSNEP